MTELTKKIIYTKDSHGHEWAEEVKQDHDNLLFRDINTGHSIAFIRADNKAELAIFMNGYELEDTEFAGYQGYVLTADMMRIFIDWLKEVQ